MGTAYCSHIGWLVGRASATLEGDIRLLNMKVGTLFAIIRWIGLGIASLASG